MIGAASWSVSLHFDILDDGRILRRFERRGLICYLNPRYAPPEKAVEQPHVRAGFKVEIAADDLDRLAPEMQRDAIRWFTLGAVECRVPEFKPQFGTQLPACPRPQALIVYYLEGRSQRQHLDCGDHVLGLRCCRLRLASDRDPATASWCCRCYCCSWCRFGRWIPEPGLGSLGLLQAQPTPLCEAGFRQFSTH